LDLGDLEAFGFFGDLAIFGFLAAFGLVALAGDFAFFGDLAFFGLAAPAFLAFLGEPAAFGFLAALGFLALTAFFSAFSPSRKLPDAPLPFDCLSEPFLTPALSASFRCALTARSSPTSL